MSTIYLAAAAAERLAEAQRALDVHVLSIVGGCRVCRTRDQCPAHVEAASVFARYHRLPRRRPGASGVSRSGASPGRTS